MQEGKIYYIYAYLPFGSIKHPSFNFVTTLSVPSLLLNIIIAWPRSFSQNMIIFSSSAFIKQNATYHVFFQKLQQEKREKKIRQVKDINVFHTRVGGRYFGALHHFCRTMLLQSMPNNILEKIFTFGKQKKINIFEYVRVNNISLSRIK